MIKLKLLAYLLKTTGFDKYMLGNLSTDLFSIARYAPSAWNNEDVKSKRELVVLLGGPDKSIDGWRR